MSNKIVLGVLSEAPNQMESGALTDDELSVVAGGATNRLVQAFLDGFYKGAGMECVTSSKSVVCF